MKNLITELSSKLQSQLNDYKVSIIFIEDNELNVRSDYDMDYSYYEAIKNELTVKGFEI